MKTAVAVLSVAFIALLGACGGPSGVGAESEGPAVVSGPTGRIQLNLDGVTPLVTIAIRNVFDHSQTFLVDCNTKDHTLDGHAFCDELTALAPGVYEIIVQSQDPDCHSEQDHYKVIVRENETVEVPITLVCGSANGGLDVIVTEEHRPTITGLSFPGANKFICQECAGENGDVDVPIQVVDTDTACIDLATTWSAASSGGTDVTASLLSGFQLLPQDPGGPCVFQATIDAGAPLGDDSLTFTVSDEHIPASAVTFPIHIIDCACAVLQTNTGTAMR